MKIEKIDDRKYFSFIYGGWKKMITENIEAYYFITSLTKMDTLTIYNEREEEVLHVICRYSFDKKNQKPIFEIIRSRIPPYPSGRIVSSLGAICFKEESFVSCSSGLEPLNRMASMVESWNTYSARNLTDITSSLENEDAIKQHAIAGAFPLVDLDKAYILIEEMV